MKPCKLNNLYFYNYFINIYSEHKIKVLHDFNKFYLFFTTHEFIIVCCAFKNQN